MPPHREAAATPDSNEPGDDERSRQKVFRDATSARALRREISRLGRLFGAVIRRFAGKSNYELVERVRILSSELRAGNTAAGSELRALLANLDAGQLKVVIRSFTLFLELANLAEDRHRVRVLRERDQVQRPRSESIAAVIAKLKDKGMSAAKLQGLVDNIHIELVLTAHPTEAKRRSVRRLLRQIQDVLSQADTDAKNVEHRAELRSELIGLLEVLWHTDLIRPWRPTVLQEVERGLAFLPNLWQEAPEIVHDLRRSLQLHYPSVQLAARPLIDFGSWIGGDRDGNPFVTAEVTKQSLILLRRHAIDAHRATCRRLLPMLSISNRQAPPYPPLQRALEAITASIPELAPIIESLPPLESYRRWIKVIEWRLDRTSGIDLDSPFSADVGVYATADALLSDVQLMADALRNVRCRHFVEAEIEPWIDQIRIFGFHSARLDVRQHAEVYREVVDEIWQALDMLNGSATLTENERLELLVKSMKRRLPSDFKWSAATSETLALFQLLHRVGERFGMSALGEHVISMTGNVSDILNVQALWQWSAATNGEHGPKLRLPIVPLFETIDDLRRGPSILRGMLENAEYRSYLNQLGSCQTVMIGYSDSTKDGGYLAAQWALHQSQIELQRVAGEFGVTLTFFHGRGGALGRGGGPAARSILSLPHEAFSGSLRLTEQGEVLAERYDNPHIAQRHFEQLVWAGFTALARPPEPIPHDCAELMQLLADEAWAAYRALVEHPAFGDYYRAVTPISLIERLPIGSRPAKRKSGKGIEDLRAIPWVFSWTQNRCLLPAWFGIGAAYEAVSSRTPTAKATIASTYREVSFFTSVIDNAALALAKANMDVFRQYCCLANSIDAEKLRAMIIDEFNRARHAVLEITGYQELLDDVPWLQQSIRIRNGYVDPLNLTQVELTRRIREASTACDASYTEELQHLASLTVKGIATGMRTTG